jgi:hypothetical protein
MESLASQGANIYVIDQRTFEFYSGPTLIRNDRRDFVMTYLFNHKTGIFEEFSYGLNQVIITLGNVKTQQMPVKELQDKSFTDHLTFESGGLNKFINPHGNDSK